MRSDKTGSEKTGREKKPTRGRWSSKRLAVEIARIADEKQAENTVVLDVGQAIQVTDYFVIASGKNRRHIGVIAEHVAKQLKGEGVYRMGGTPMQDENWVLLDFGPVVLHVFGPKARLFYDLENLWGDAKRVKWQPRKKPEAAAEPAPPTVTE